MNTVSKKNEGFQSFPSLVSDFFNMDRFFSDDFFTSPVATRMPAVNIRESEGGFSVEAAVPGFAKDELSVHIDKGILTLSGESKSETKKDEERFARREFHYNAFNRSFRLPEQADADQVNASFENGILKLEIPKKAGSVPSGAKQITIA